MTAVINTNLMGISQYSGKEQERSCFSLSKQRVITDSTFRTARACRKQGVSVPPFPEVVAPSPLRERGGERVKNNGLPPLPNPLPDGERAYCDTLSLEGYDCVNAGGRATQEAKAEGLGEGEKR